MRMKKQLATLDQLQSSEYVQIMQQVNRVAARGELQEYTTYSRLWEYPWIWLQLETLRETRKTVLDVGSQYSPFPWFLSLQGFDVIVSDYAAACWETWQHASRLLNITPRRYVLDSQNLDLPTASIDIYLSVSVIEHVADKTKAIAQAARVLRPGGLLIITFDICEPEMGMTFPEWNGCALSMCEFDALFRDSPWFESGLAELSWNTQAIPAYLAWNRSTAPHHNYVTGAAVVQRNARVWNDSPLSHLQRDLLLGIRTPIYLTRWRLWQTASMAKRKARQLLGVDTQK